MKADHDRLTYEIQETPGSLVITYRGNQNRGRALIILLSVILAFAYLLGGFALLIPNGSSPESEFQPLIYLCLGSFILLLVYGAYVALSWALDQMLDREQVTLTATSLTVEKSGYGSIHLTREFYLKESDCLHPTSILYMFEGIIELSPSRFLARASQMGSGRTLLFTSPMRWFCRGLTKEDHLAILTRIKAKFPNINVLLENEPLVGPG
jgi:hypothetical protein